MAAPPRPGPPGAAVSPVPAPPGPKAHSAPAPSRAAPDDESPLALSTPDDHHVNLHIVGPAVTNDSQVLSDYLSGIPEAMRSIRMVVPELAGRSRPVLFTIVQKRQLGVTVNRSPSAEKLELIEKLLEPCTAAVIDGYARSCCRRLPPKS